MEDPGSQTLAGRSYVYQVLHTVCPRSLDLCQIAIYYKLLGHTIWNKYAADYDFLIVLDWFAVFYDFVYESRKHQKTCTNPEINLKKINKLKKKEYRTKES